VIKLGPGRIKKMIRRKHGIEFNTESEDLDKITKEAQEIEYK
jgi:hypothetical protein